MKFDAAKALAHKVVLIGGAEEALRRAALRALLAAVSPDEEDFDRESIFADAKAPMEWVASAGTAPFLSPRRTTLIRNLLRVDPRDWAGGGAVKDKDHPLAKAFLGLPDTALLVLVADDESGDEAKQRTLAGLGKRWASLVTAGGGFVASFDVDPKKVAEAVRQEVQGRGLKMSPAAASLLAEMSGGRLSVALAEIEKLAVYIGASDTIRESDVREAATPEKEYNVYGLVDAVVAGEQGRALTQLRILFDRADRVENEAFPRVFPTLLRQFRLIWQARLCIEDGCSPKAPSSAVRAMLPEKPNLSTEGDWSQERAMRAARRIGLAATRACFDELVDADAKMKGLRPSFDAMDTLEQMVLRMCVACRS